MGQLDREEWENIKRELDNIDREFNKPSEKKSLRNYILYKVDGDE